MRDKGQTERVREKAGDGSRGFVLPGRIRVWSGVGFGDMIFYLFLKERYGETNGQIDHFHSVLLFVSFPGKRGSWAGV
jgi:hypothetical protein